MDYSKLESYLDVFSHLSQSFCQWYLSLWDIFDGVPAFLNNLVFCLSQKG